MDHLEQFNALRQCYGAYLADCRQRAQDAGPLRGLTHLLAGPSLQDRQAVDRFFQQLKDVVSALDRADCQAQERHSFLQRVYRGAAGDMITAFLKEEPLSPEEREKLRKLLDDMEV